MFFDPERKTIVWRSEKKLKMGTQPKLTIDTEKAVMKNTNEDPKQIASISVAAAQENPYNVGKLK